MSALDKDARCVTARKYFETWLLGRAVSNDGGTKLPQPGSAQPLDGSSQQSDRVSELRDPVVLINAENTTSTGSSVLSLDSVPESVEVVVNNLRFSHDPTLCESCTQSRAFYKEFQALAESDRSISALAEDMAVAS